MSEWKDISTAPKDGSYILVAPCPVAVFDHEYGDWTETKSFVAWPVYWSDGAWRTNENTEYFPTDWMPLPPPPAPKGDKQ
jgi:hypothetical protein